MRSTINKFGMFKGGVCESIFKQRQGREKGTRLAWNWLLDNKCVEVNRGWYKIIKLPKKLRSFCWPIDSICKVHGGDAEIGWRRFISDIAAQLLNKKSFRLKWMEKWIVDLASFEIALGSDNMPFNEGHALGANGPVRVGYAPPHQSELYNKWVKDKINN